MTPHTIALDVDNTISANPLFFRLLSEAWIAQGGHVHIVTARPQKDERRTLEQLDGWGFTNCMADDERFHVHHYPHDYDYPYPVGTDIPALTDAHATWKAKKCKEIGATALFDDSAANIAKCSQHGVFGLLVGGIPFVN